MKIPLTPRGFRRDHRQALERLSEGLREDIPRGSLYQLDR